MASLSIVFTGDILPTRRLAPAPPAAQAVYRILDEADVAIGNFEMPLSVRGAPVEKLLNIIAPPEIAEDIPGLGLDVVTVANNHAVDYGWAALADTVAGLTEAGLVVVGAGSNIDEAMRPAIVHAGGQRVGVIAFSCLLPTGMAAAPARPGISPIHIETAYEIDSYYQMEEPGDPSAVRIRTSVRPSDRVAALAAVAALKADCDVVVVTIHWGFGSGEALAEYQRPLAEALIDAGADIVHGHHPHAVQAIGFHRGRPILYSLGTFVGQQVFLDASSAVQALWAAMSPDGYVARLDVGPRGAQRLTATPTTLDADRLPVVAADAVFSRIANRLTRLSQPHGASVRRSGDGLLIEPLQAAERPESARGPLVASLAS